LTHINFPPDNKYPYRPSPTGHTRRETFQRFSTRGDQFQPDSNSRRHNSYSYNSSSNISHRFSGEKPGPMLKSNSSIDVKPQPILADKSSQPTSRQRGITFSVPAPVIRPGSLTRFGVYGPQPVYMLTSHLPHILPTKVHGPFGVPYVQFPHFTHQLSPLYPGVESVNAGDREPVSTYCNSDLLPPNAQIGELNAIRTQTFNNSPRQMAQQTQQTNIKKHLRQTNTSSDDRTIWVGCLSAATLQLSFDRVLTLFSRCGNIEDSRVLIQKFCAFIT
jgi:hypothetical protein